MRSTIALGAAALAAAALTACGGGSPGTSTNTSTTPGTLIESPPLRVASLNATDLNAQLTATSQGQALVQLAGTPTCGVDFHYFHYQTVGGKGEATTASGAIMAPTGGTGCSGARPILVYTHGTAVTKTYNIANITDATNEGWQEGAMIAAFFAAHGYIVVASNYAGYDSSPLPYHPYLNADQQSKDVINALAAARTALANGLPSGVTDNGKLFITGYSQGGHVAMATHRAMEAAGMTVTAAAPMSGPYAMLAFGDAAIAYSSPGLGGTIYYPMIVNSYQQSYGNVYTAPTDVFSSTYATGIDTLIPGQYTYTTLVSSGKLPQFAVFDVATPGTGSEPSTGNAQLDAILAQPSAASNPIGNLGFGDPFLFTNALRIKYALDAVQTPDGFIPSPTTLMPPAATPLLGIRADLQKNDLRGWSPKAPVLLCGGMNDPEVFYKINTLAMKALWAPQITAGLVSVVDIDPSTNGDPTKAGQLPTLVGTIAAGVYASEPTAGAAKISADVQTAVLSNAAFASYFSAGVPNSPQGVMALEVASVAQQATALYLGQGVTDPATLATDVGNGLVANYHFPLTQTACETAAQAYFAHF